MIEMFLCSYFAGAATLFEDYARQNIRAKEVLFIPTAANVEEYRDYVDEAKEAFAKMGFEVQILDVSKASEAEAKAKIGVARVLYVSGEESASQIKMRAQRLGAISEQLFLLTEINLGAVLEEVERRDYKFIVIDSIQTLLATKPPLRRARSRRCARSRSS